MSQSQHPRHGPRDYTLGSSRFERDRLRAQADDLRPHSEALFAAVGVRSGWRVLDLGCGPRGNLDLLAELTAPDGTVRGIDADPGHVEIARAQLADLGRTDVRVDVADARGTGLPARCYDLVHARLLLINVPWPEAIVAEMVRLARPGGWVTGEEADAIFLCHPPHPAWDRLVAVYTDAWRAEHADPQLGRRLPELYRSAGLRDVGVRVFADSHPPGHRRRMIVPDLARSMRPKILQHGLSTEAELDRLDAAVREHISSPRTVLVPMLYFTVWGRRPADG